MEFLTHDDRKISLNKIPLTNVIETKILIKNLIKNNKKSRANKLTLLLYNRITQAAIKNITITKNIWQELNEINQIIN